jgi:hypothetical protein
MNFGKTKSQTSYLTRLKLPKFLKLKSFSNLLNKYYSFFILFSCTFSLIGSKADSEYVHLCFC